MGSLEVGKLANLTVFSCDFLKDEAAIIANADVYERNVGGAQGSNNDDAVKINIGSTKVPENLSLDEALTIGVVSVISSYTTTYSSGAGTENRNKNIALGAAALNNTICSANGGR